MKRKIVFKGRISGLFIIILLIMGSGRAKSMWIHTDPGLKHWM